MMNAIPPESLETSVAARRGGGDIHSRFDACRHAVTRLGAVIRRSRCSSRVRVLLARATGTRAGRGGILPARPWNLPMGVVGCPLARR